MTGQELGACEWFIWDLRRSELLDHHLVDKVTLDYLQQHPDAQPAELADYLVTKGLLTRFQADSLLNGRANTLVLGPYVLHEPIGTGSMGTVYRARSRRQPDQWFAVKILPRRSMWNIRLAKRQVREFESFSHPAVVPFADIGTSGGLHYLVWPYVEGETLDKLVAREGKLEMGRAVAYVIQAAEGLAVCHERGLIHGLIKPSNLLRTPQDQVCVLDFGVGSLLMENENESVVDTMSSANALQNNLDCASPESIADPAQVGPASDQYSLGCVLYYLLSGQYPFGGETAIEKMMAHQTASPQPLRQYVPDLPEQLEAIVQRMLAKSPSDRYPSLLHVIQALGPFLQGPAALHVSWSRVARPGPGGIKPSHAEVGSVGGGVAPAKSTPLPSYTLADAVARRTPIPSSSPPPNLREPPGPAKHAEPVGHGQAISSPWQSNEPRPHYPSPVDSPAGASGNASLPLTSAAYWSGQATPQPPIPSASPRISAPKPLLAPLTPIPTQTETEQKSSRWVILIDAILAVACGVLAWYLAQLFL